MRHLLTSIYQRHCARVEESEGSGLERFGKRVFLCHVAIYIFVQRGRWNEITL